MKNREINPNKHIIKTKNGKYRIYKYINGHVEYFGTLPTLEDAREYRDYLVANKWDLKLRICNKRENKTYKLPRNIYKKEYGGYSLMKSINGKNTYFGVFKTLDEAIEHKKYCESQNWSRNCIKKKDKTFYKYIYQINNRYRIQKSIDGELKYFGIFDNLEHAIKERNELIANNWGKNSKDNDKISKKDLAKDLKNITYNNGKFCVRRYKNGQSRSFGTFETVDEAVKRRDYCESKDWDVSLIKLHNNPDKYILKDHRGKYVVRKEINHKMVYFGGYDTLEEAKIKRDEFIRNNWNQDLKEYKNKKYGLPKHITLNHGLYTIQKRFKDGSYFRMSFSKLKDAIHERDLLIDCNWDIEELIYLDEAMGTL